jgi:hypothetical protein
MDTSNCPNGAFTDDILMFLGNSNNNNNGGALVRCDSPIAGYQAFLIVISLLRISLGLMQFRFWYQRIQLTKSSHVPSVFATTRRYPIIPSLSLLAGCLELLFFTLTTVNVANDKNSLSVTLIGLFYLPVMFAHVLYMHKVIRLGRRIIPKSSAMVDLFQERAVRLAAYDQVLRLLLALFGTTLVGICVTLVVAPFYPGNPLPFQIMSAFVGCYQVSAAFAVIWQLQRCRFVIAASERALQGRVDRLSPQRLAVQYATKKMKQQQFTCLMVAVNGGLFNTLIAAQVIHASWYLVCIILFGFENLFESVSVWNMTRRMPRSHMNRTAHANNATGETSVSRYGRVADEGRLIVADITESHSHVL